MSAITTNAAMVNIEPDGINADCVALLIGYRNDEGAAAFRNYWRDAAKAGAFNDAQTVGELALAYLDFVRAEIVAGAAFDNPASAA